MRERKFRSVVAACAMAAFATTSLLATNLPSSAQELRKVSFGLSSLAINAGHASYTSVPMAMGFFEEEGLEVSILPFAGGEAINHVVAGDVIAAEVGTPAVFSAISRGVNVITVAANISGNPYFMVAPEESSIKTVADYAGKTIGVYDVAAAGFALFKGILEVNGVDPASVTTVTIKSPAEAIDAITRDRIEAYHAFDTLYAEMGNLGMKLRRISTPQGDSLGFLSGIVTTRENATAEHETLVKLVRAISKGVVFAMENPEAAVRLTWKVFPDSKPLGMSEEEAMAAALRAFNARAENLGPVEGSYALASDAQVETLLDLLNRGGVLGTPLQPEQVWTADLIDEINDFDAEAVKALARDWKPD